MDTLEQKLAQALQREVHLTYSLESERRCNESLRELLRITEKGVNALASIDKEHVRRIDALTAERDTLVAELTLAKQETGNALHELRSAVAVIEEYANPDNWRGTYPCDYDHHEWRRQEEKGGATRARDWLALHAQQTKAPLDPPVGRIYDGASLDPEADAERALEHVED